MEPYKEMYYKLFNSVTDKLASELAPHNLSYWERVQI